MRVLHLDAGNDLRGGQRQVLLLAEGLGQESVLLTPANSPLMKAARERGVNVKPLSIGAITAMSRRVDLLHAHDARSHSWGAALGAAPLVVSRRVAFPVKRSALSRWKYRRPKRYLAVSEHVKQTLMEAEVAEDRISVVYDGVELPDKTSAGDRIVALKSQDPMKGGDLVREAARLAGLPVHYSSDLESDLPSAAIFVYITLSEGLGSAALRAMAYGVPVVASRIGGLPEIVLEGRTGVLTDNEPRAIACAMKRAIVERSALSQTARQSIEERFCARHMIDNTVSVYRQVLA